MKLFFIIIVVSCCLQACNPKPQIPACEPNDETQYAYRASGGNVRFPVSTLMAFTDFHEGIACAQRQNKPVYLAFTGFGCVRTRFFPDVILQNPVVVNYLLNEFVPIILYVDDRKKLPAGQVEDIIEEDGSITRIRTVGNRNAYIQRSMFQRATQPYMVWMTWGGDLLASPRSYDPNISHYVESFRNAYAAFKQQK